jgi:hypothetical protein
MADNQLNKILGAAKLTATRQTIYTASSTGNGKQVLGTLLVNNLDKNNIMYLEVTLHDGTNEYIMISNLGIAYGRTEEIKISVADGQSIKVRMRTAPTQMTISGITAANPPVVTVNTTTDLANTDLIDMASIGGMVEITDGSYRTANKTATTFELQDLDGIDIDGSAYTVYTSGGTVNKRLGDAIFMGYEEDIPQV